MVLQSLTMAAGWQLVGLQSSEVFAHATEHCKAEVLAYALLLAAQTKMHNGSRTATDKTNST